MRRLLLAIGFLCCASRVEAVCNQTTVANPTPAQIQTKLDALIAGQTACIPDGTTTFTGTQTITIAHGTRLRGQNDVTTDVNGRPTACGTTLVDGTTSALIIWMTPTAAVGELTELDNLCIDKSNNIGTGEGQAVYVYGTGLNSFRVHHVRINNLLGRFTTIHSNPAGSNYSGLVDHNYCKKTATGSPQCGDVIGALAWDNSPMARGYTLGTNSAVYFEDNTIEFCCEKADSAYDGYGGCQWVARYNIVINTEISLGHGNDSGGFRGCRSFEVYGNLFSNSISNINPGQYRSGSGPIWGNIYTGGWTDYTPTIYRACPQEFVGSMGETYGPGDGTSPWDTNIGPHGYIYVDMWGWTFDNVQGHAPSRTPVYIWNNTDDGNPIAVVPGAPGTYSTAYNPTGACTYNQTDFLQADREWFLKNASFTGSSGMGVGTRAAMNAIATCTQYTAFWVTDEGEWNSTNGAAADGRLYQCNPTNTWTLYYTPYTYPHPLQGAAGGGGGNGAKPLIRMRRVSLDTDYLVAHFSLEATHVARTAN